MSVGPALSERAYFRTVATSAILDVVTFRKAQRNDVFRAVEAGDLDPAECEFGYGGHGAWLRHSLSNSNLSISGDGHDHYICRSQIGEDEPKQYGAGNWEGVPPLIRKWASDVKRYAETSAQIPDLWAELQRNKEFLTDVRYDNDENSPFSPDEQAEIAQRLRAIKEDAQQKYSLTDDQMERFTANLDKIEEASHRIGRKDWVLLFYGALFSLVLANVLSSDAVYHILGSFLQSLGYFFGIGGPPPPIPPTA